MKRYVKLKKIRQIVVTRVTNKIIYNYSPTKLRLCPGSCAAPDQCIQVQSISL